MAICSFSLLSCVLSPPILRRPTRGEILCLNISTKVKKKTEFFNQAASGFILNCLMVRLFSPDLAVAGLYFGTFVLLYFCTLHFPISVQSNFSFFYFSRPHVAVAGVACWVRPTAALCWPSTPLPQAATLLSHFCAFCHFFTFVFLYFCVLCFFI